MAGLLNHAHLNVNAHLYPETPVSVEALGGDNPGETQTLWIGGSSGRLVVFAEPDQMRRLRDLIDARLAVLDDTAGSVGD